MRTGTPEKVTVVLAYPNPCFSQYAVQLCLIPRPYPLHSSRNCSIRCSFFVPHPSCASAAPVVSSAAATHSFSGGMSSTGAPSPDARVTGDDLGPTGLMIELDWVARESLTASSPDARPQPFWHTLQCPYFFLSAWAAMRLLLPRVRLLASDAPSQRYLFVNLFINLSAGYIHCIGW